MEQLLYLYRNALFFFELAEPSIQKEYWRTAVYQLETQIKRGYIGEIGDDFRGTPVKYINLITR